MSNSATDVEIRIKLRDQGVQNALDRAARAAEQAARRAERANNGSNDRQRASNDRLSHAREMLGVRAENRIQREIQATEAAYKRLERSGTMSQEALSRAAEKTYQRITRLTNEMGKLTLEQQRAAQAAERYEKIQGRIRLGVAAGVGIAAGAYALKAPIETAMSFDERLAGMANTAYPERDAAGRTRGAKELEAVINRATDLKRGGGGTRDQAAQALDIMLARGTLGFQKSLDFLPTVMRTAYGASADPANIASLASALYGQGFVKDDKGLKTALNMITAAGQAGGFEIKDLAKHLPAQLPLAANGGMLGLSGLQKVLTMNEAAIMTSQGTDEAGRNVINLLTKMISQDTAKDFEKAGRGDLSQYMINQRLKGVDVIDSWMSIIDSESAKNPNLKNALKRVGNAKDPDEKQAMIDAISHLSEGSVIGRYFQDMQARGALFGMRNTGLVNRINAFVGKNRSEYGANDVNYDTMSATGAAAVRNAEQEFAIRQKEAMEKLIPTITKAADLFVDLSQKYPNLSAAVVGATGPVIALGAAAGISAMALGAGNLGAIGRVASSVLGTGFKGGGVALAGTAAYAAGRYVAGPWAKDGIDSLVQMGSGDKNTTLGSWFYDKTHPDVAAALAPKPLEATADINIKLAPGLELVKKGQTSNGMNLNVNSSGNTGNIWNGAP